MIATKLNRKVEHWDDERNIGNSILVTLKPGWRWGGDPQSPTHVEGFDTPKEAKAELRSVMPCACKECKQ
jgi:hypothetical protein